MKIWTTKDLLFKTLEFKGMVPNLNEWNENSLKYNEPRLIRYKRLIALLKAYGITHIEVETYTSSTLFNRNKKKLKTKNAIESFFHGNFIFKREPTVYPKTQELIEKEKLFNSDTFDEKRDIYMFYRNLMDYRIVINNVLSFNSGVLEASSLGFRSAMNLTDQLNNDLHKKVEKIDNLLFEIINPKNLKFSEDILIKEYGFPTDDLDAIDIEYV